MTRPGETALRHAIRHAARHATRPAWLRDRLDQINAQLEQHRNNLAQLEMQAAQHGPIDVPLDTWNALATTREAIEDLEQERITLTAGWAHLADQTTHVKL